MAEIDLVAVYPARASAPLDAWRAIFEQAERRIGILVYAALFLHELWPDFNRLLRGKAARGCRVTVLLGDPASEAVARRGREEKYGHGIESRCRQALMHDDAGRILLQRRADSGNWAMPGGAMEITESLTGSVIREVRKKPGTTSR